MMMPAQLVHSPTLLAQHVSRLSRQVYMFFPASAGKGGPADPSLTRSHANVLKYTHSRMLLRGRQQVFRFSPVPRWLPPVRQTDGTEDDELEHEFSDKSQA